MVMFNDLSAGYGVLRQKAAIFSIVVLGLLSGTSVSADPFPPEYNGGAGASIHFAPAPWPSEPLDAADCSESCGNWKPYTRFQNSVNDPRAQDDSNGGTAPQNYVNIASSCTDKAYPSIYYYLHQGAAIDGSDDVIMFRWRVEQIANNYATGPNAGAFGASNPWSSALWTVLFDIDGGGFRSLAAHLNGSSGSPSEAIDMLAGVWSNSPSQSIDYVNDPGVHLLAHNPTAFIDAASNKVLNFQNSLTPSAIWPNGTAETVWDYGTSRARLVSTRSCDEYFVDYQIPVSMLDASSLNGPKITRSTPISMMFCTANSLNNPFQKDCAINNAWSADANLPAPFGDYISFDRTEPYSQPIISEVTAVAPQSCGQDYELNARVQDVIALVNGETASSLSAVDFYYWYDANGSGEADDIDGSWMHAATANQVPGTLNEWNANWSASDLPRGRYLIGVQAVDDNTLVDADMVPTGVNNRTFSYLAGDAQSQIYIGGSFIAGQQASFPNHSPGLTPDSSEDWYGNPDVTGIKTALIGVALNTCGVAPTLSLSADQTEVAPSETVNFSITLSNAGNTSAVAVDSITTVLPDGFSYQGPTSGDFGTTAPGISGQTLSWTFATPVSVAANASASLSFPATASSDSGNYTLYATSVTDFAAVTSDTVTVAVGSARLALYITPDSFSLSPGGQVTYTLDYSNPSTMPVSATSLSVPLPGDTSFSSCSDSCSSSGPITWNLGALDAGASGSVTLTLDISAAFASTALTTAATLSGLDPASNPASASTETTAFVNVPAGNIAALTLESSASAVQIAPGGNVTYTLSYQNFGGASATNTVLTSLLPAGMTFSSCSDMCSDSGGLVTWNLGMITSNASGFVTLTATADTPFESANPAVNTAEINWDGGSPVNTVVSVGITGLSCSTYYFRDSTTSVGFDGSQRVATLSPVPLSGDTGSSVNVVAPVAGAAFLEAVRFYQDPATNVDTEFSGTVDTRIYIDRANGPGLDIQGSLYDYDSITGNTTQLGQQIFSFGGNSKGLLQFSVPVIGTLQKDHRLLWTIEVRSQHNSQTFDVQIQYNGTVTNTVSGGSTFADSGASFCVTPPANLIIDKTVDLASVPESTTSNVVYTIEYANLGESSATNVEIVDTLPGGVNLDSATLNGISISPTGSNPYTFAVGSVVAADSGTLLINATVSNSATGELTNSADISSDQTSTVTDTASTLVGTPAGAGAISPELYVSLQASTGLANAGDTVSYTLTVVNAGNGDASNVTLSNDFPDQSYYSYQNCSTASGSCSEAPAGNLGWTIGSLTAGSSASLTYQMQVASSGLPSGLTTLINNASLSDDDYCSGTLPASCSSEAITVVINGNPELAMALTVDNASVAPGDLVTYTVNITNNGSSTANELKVINPVPANMGFEEITSGTGSFDTLNNQLVLTAGSLASAASTSFEFTLRVASVLPPGSTSMLDTATLTASNSAAVSDSVNVTATAAAAITLSLGGAQNIPFPATTLAADAAASNLLEVNSSSLLSTGDIVRINGVLTQINAINGNRLSVSIPVTATGGAALELAATYSIRYQNMGNADATNVQLSQPLPAGWVFVSAPTAVSTPGVGAAGTISWNVGTLAAGDSGTQQFVALPVISGSFVHSTSLNADNSINETADLTTLVGGLVVQKSAADNFVEAGGTVSYTISVTNTLSTAVNGVTVKDILPAGFTFAASNPVPTVADPEQPGWTINVAAGSTSLIELTVTVDVDAGAAVYQNELEVSAPVGIGVAQFDALLETAEDVTLLRGTGLMTGSVSFDNEPLAGVWLEFYDNDVLAYRVYTDSAGRYQRVLEAGSNWRIEIGSVSENSSALAGLELTAGMDPHSFVISTGDSLTNDYVYALAQPTVNSQTTTSTNPTITGTYPSAVSGIQLSVIVDGVTYTPGADLTTLGDTWSLSIPLANQLSVDVTYEVQANVARGEHSRSDATGNELVILNNDADNDGIPDATDPDDDNDGIPDSEEGSADTDGDGVPDNLDTDSDNDGIPDIEEGTADTDGDGVLDRLDLDSDNDGIPDAIELNVDTDGDGVIDSLDLDSDNDGLYDLQEMGLTDPDALDENNDGRIDASNDFGVNGLADAVESSVDSGMLAINGGDVIDTDGDNVRDFRDVDSDNDGIPDVTETGGSDPDGDGRLGTGVPVVDADGIPVGGGLTPVDTDGDGLPDHRDLDADGDGIRDIVEAGGTDSNDDGLVDGFTDTDGDGFDDGVHNTPLSRPDADGDNIPDFQDIDDVDNDGIKDNDDLDDDNDGIPDQEEGNGLVDTDNDGIADSFDLDSDNDGILDVVESGADNPANLDKDRDGRIDDSFAYGSNGLADIVETSADSGVINYNGGTPRNTDADDVADFRDLDSDGDGDFDVVESGGDDPDNDGVVGTGTPYININGIPARGKLATVDSDNSGVADYLESSAPPVVEPAVEPAVVQTGLKGIGSMRLCWLMLLLPLFLLRRGKAYGLLLVLLPGLSQAAELTAQSAAGQSSEPAATVAEQAAGEIDTDEDFRRRLYLGAGIGRSFMDPETAGTGLSISDDSDLGYRIYLGYDVNSLISVDLSIADLGTTKLAPAGDIDYAINSANILFYLYDQNRADHIGWAVYLKGGIGSIQNDASVAYERVNSLQASLGGGIEYAWDNGVAARLDFESYDRDASLVTVGLLYRFGFSSEDEKPVEAAPEDSDRDGVFDINDQCPDSHPSAIVDINGCEKDSDQDGVIDRIDQCPATPQGRVVDEKGCSKDNDGDGVLNDIDQCPVTIAGAEVNASGCAIFEARLEGVNFETASADLTEGARQVLDKVADALTKFLTVHVEIQAHTDSVGKKGSNQTLSEARAKSVADYLESKGIVRDRMETVGYGETTPIAGNETPSGRKQNRRVEFRVLTDTPLEDHNNASPQS